MATVRAEPSRPRVRVELALGLLVFAFLLASAAASYVGSKRGAQIHAHNQRVERLRRK